MRHVVTYIVLGIVIGVLGTVVFTTSRRIDAIESQVVTNAQNVQAIVNFINANVESDVPVNTGAPAPTPSSSE